MNSLAVLKKTIAERHGRGLALDIDETLSKTEMYWATHMHKAFGGGPDNSTPEALIKQHRYADKVPHWHTPEGRQWFQENVHKSESYEDLPIIPNANDSIQEIEKIIPVVLYITGRSEGVEQATERWLERHNFPAAPILSRPLHLHHDEAARWKAETLTELQPEVVGIIDDNPLLYKDFPHTYGGTIFLYDYKHTPDTKLQVIPCPTWEDVYVEIKKMYGEA